MGEAPSINELTGISKPMVNDFNHDGTVSWWETALGALLGVSKAVFAFIKPQLQLAVSEAGKQLIPIALQIVKEQAQRNLLHMTGDEANTERKAAAVKELRAEAAERGIAIADRFLDGIVQDAYIQFRGDN